MIVRATAIDRFKDNYGRTIGYKLRDQYGTIMDVKLADICKAVKQRKIIITNIETTTLYKEYNILNGNTCRQQNNNWLNSYNQGMLSSMIGMPSMNVNCDLGYDLGYNAGNLLRG